MKARVRRLEFVETVAARAASLLQKGIIYWCTELSQISDFGLSREDSIYNMVAQELPYRWVAPEVIKYRMSDIYSDIWSFGVTVW